MILFIVSHHKTIAKEKMKYKTNKQPPTSVHLSDDPLPILIL